MKKIITLLSLALLVLASCEDDNSLKVPYYDDLDFNEVELDRFTHKVVSSGIDYKGAHFNTSGSDRNFEGFAYSNRSNRSFVWRDVTAAQDSNRFSVYTPKPNMTGVYLVGCAKNDNCYFTFSKPQTIEYILIAPTTENYLGMYYGPNSGAEPIANPNVPSAPKAVWQTYIPNLTAKMNAAAGDYLKVVVTGFRNGSETGKVDMYLASFGADPAYGATAKYMRSEWTRTDLASLGEVDKVLFTMESSAMHDGRMIYPPYFCLDGIRLKK